jgi:HAD superfamily hydrolase (TIGR01509 family)
LIERPRGLLIDMGGTLLDERGFDPEAGTARVLELAHNPRRLSAADVQALVSALDADLYPRRESVWMELSPWAVHRLVYEPNGITFERPVAEIEREFLSAARTWVPEPGVADALEDLRRRGLPLGVVSNSAFSSTGLAWELGRHGLGDLFEFVMSSADYVVRKPHPALFAAAALKLNCPARELWYVGDTLRYDVAGANAAGLGSVWYNRRGAPPRDGLEPGLVVRGWRELRDLVAARCD